MSRRTIICQFCGENFESDVRPGTRPSYCSKECRNRAGTKRSIERHASMADRRCPRCGEVKPTSEFAGLTHPYCRPCHAAYARVSRASKTPEQKARARLQDTAWRNSTTVEALLLRLESQGGLCAICRSDLNGDSRRWHVDHDHDCCSDTNGKNPGKRQRACGKCIRGILCGNCNSGLGMFRDDLVILRTAVTYLEAAATIGAHIE